MNFNLKEYFLSLKKEISLNTLRDLHNKINDIIKNDDENHTDLIEFMTEFEKTNWSNHKGYVRMFLITTKTFCRKSVEILDIHTRIRIEFFKNTKFKV